MSSLYFGLDVCCLLEVRAFDLDMKPLPLMHWGNCGDVHHGKFSGSSLEYAANIRPKDDDDIFLL
jgi:hypothetical protein